MNKKIVSAKPHSSPSLVATHTNDMIDRPMRPRPILSSPAIPIRASTSLLLPRSSTQTRRLRFSRSLASKLSSLSSRSN